MTRKPNTATPKTPDWQQAYMTTAATLGASWCDFLGARFHAYAHMIDDVSHCHGFDEALKVQATFGQQTLKDYSEQAARMSGLMMQAARGETNGRKHH